MRDTDFQVSDAGDNGLDCPDGNSHSTTRWSPWFKCLYFPPACSSPPWHLIIISAVSDHYAGCPFAIVDGNELWGVFNIMNPYICHLGSYCPNTVALLHINWSFWFLGLPKPGREVHNISFPGDAALSFQVCTISSYKTVGNINSQGDIWGNMLTDLLFVNKSRKNENYNW